MTTGSIAGNNNLNNEITQWACQYLSSHKYTLKNNQPEKIHVTPWSYVARFETSKGYIYLKSMPGPLALEANIIKILPSQFHISVPEVITSNTKLNCFLMKRCG